MLAGKFTITIFNFDVFNLQFAQAEVYDTIKVHNFDKKYKHTFGKPIMKYNNGMDAKTRVNALLNCFKRFLKWKI